MSTLSPDQNLKFFIDDAAITVFDTMLAIDLQPSDRGARFKPGVSQVVGTVGIAGSVTAVLCLRVTESFACHAATGMLGIEPGEAVLESDVNDAIGELANIMAGKLKSCLRTPGRPCSLSLPAIMRGYSIDLESMSGTERHSFTFYHGGEPVVVEFYSLNQKENML
ncbi:MAG: chemotaxis protein CheX [Methylacidiphilales bacterium]|nr:chemotaxis protein CheX [Candidatus Methylacidiphilales bacterium]